MLSFWMVACRGIAGGITSGITYFDTVVGSSVPPGIASARAPVGRIPGARSPAGSNSDAPVMAPALSNWRLVSMTSLPWLFGHTNLRSYGQDAGTEYHQRDNPSRQLCLV